eukprot:Phypoly_transcript_02690.p1 GENE.Phypoly_transcript_02690~~Phypoly_transcript_02690.p1  ORF type:complete len:880 (+),score=98.16 Phypoly_transcript_02690:33-2672(+)
MSSFKTRTLQNQNYLWECLQRIFPQRSIEVNSRNNIKNSSGGWLELDLGIPDLRLGFEFQDAHHYITSWYYHQGVSSAQERDKTKGDILRSQGKTLISIPCWWDGSIKSLRESILFERPDLGLRGEPGASSITLNPAADVFESIGIPGIGELMVASFPRPTYAIFRSKITESEPWWLGEKYDGVRCCWSPKQRIVYSRRGVIFHVPRRYLRRFPNLCIDGEFWFGRSSTDAFQMMRNSGPDWQFCRIVVFDAPLAQPGTPFEQRYASLLPILKPKHPFLILATRILIKSSKKLSEFTTLILIDGGEGTILRKCQSFYENGRSTSLIKIKAYGRDLEAIVVGVTEKNWLKLKLPSGMMFKVPPSSVEVRSYPKKGDIVMLSYEKLSSLGIPVEPKLVRIRTDLSWEEVVINYNVENPKERALPGFINKFTSPAATRKYWEGDQRRIRAFFVEFARKRGLNPLDPETWYPVTPSVIKTEKGGFHMLARLGWRFTEIIKRVFPEIKFKDGLFETKTKWPTIEQRRSYFMLVARDYGFDPLVADNWYRFKPASLDHEGYNRVLRVYRFNMRKAVSDIFPDVKFDMSKFPSIKKRYWLQYENRRKYFVESADALGFDPLIAENWYLCDASSFDSKNRSIVRLFGNSFPHTIQATFPDIGLELHKFSSRPSKFWRNPENRKAFFMEFAKNHEFDPLILDNWKNIRKTEITSAPGGVGLMNVTGGNVLLAVQSVFPQFRSEIIRNPQPAGKFWHDRENRRNFFIEFAKRKNFDPEDYNNWYTLHVSQIKQGGKGLLAYYQGSLRTALIDLFPGLDVNMFPSKRYSLFFMLCCAVWAICGIVWEINLAGKKRAGKTWAPKRGICRLVSVCVRCATQATRNTSTVWGK